MHNLIYWIQSFVLPHLPNETLMIFDVFHWTSSLCFGSLTACHLILYCVFDLMLASSWQTMVLDCIVQGMCRWNNPADRYEMNHSYSLWHLCLLFWREEILLGGDLQCYQVRPWDLYLSGGSVIKRQEKRKWVRERDWVWLDWTVALSSNGWFKHKYCEMNGELHITTGIMRRYYTLKWEQVSSLKYYKWYIGL